MAFSYSGDPSTSPDDAVRFAIGDTNPAYFYLQDAEIAYCLGLTGGGVEEAAVMACEAVIAKLGPMCDQTVGSVSKSFSQQMANWEKILGNLRRVALGAGGVPFVGGTSRIANIMPYLNPDTVRPQFTTHMMRRHADWANGMGGDCGVDGVGGWGYLTFQGYPYTYGGNGLASG